MHRFWETVIKPILDILEPETIVEIGSDRGHATSRILDYCEEHKIRARIIDPFPKYDAAEWQKRHPNTFIFHRTLSLNAIPKLDGLDVVLIDGDHNWYTVFNELTLIQRTSEKLSSTFPMVFLHDVGWPYGRRDLYYHPENVPKQHQKAHKKLGIMPNKSELSKTGGLNSHLNNAILENEPESGVATAIEDFVSRSGLDLDTRILPGLYGLGMVFPKALLKQKPKLREFIDSLEIPPGVQNLIEKIESDRINHIIEVQKIEATLSELKASHQTKTEKLQEHIQALEYALSQKDMAIAVNQRDLANLTTLMLSKKERLAAAEQEIRKLSAMLNKEAERAESLQTGLVKLRKESNYALKEIASLEKRVYGLQQKLQENESQFAETRLRLSETTLERDQLSIWLAKLRELVSSMIASGGFRVGNILDKIGRRVLVQSRLQESLQRIDELVGSIDRWAKQQRAQELETQEVRHQPVQIRRKIEKPSAGPRRASISYPVNGQPIDIIVTVYNALEDVRKCIESIKANTVVPYRLIIVDDASDEPTAEYLRSLEGVTLIRNDKNLGYTRTVNVGIRESKSDIFVILNSDTIVTLGWLGRLNRVFEKCSTAGIVSPLSNASSYQSIPRVFQPGTKEWYIKSPPFDVQRWAELVVEMSSLEYPRLPNLNGFCLAIRRGVIDTIGLFDEDKYPHGYGEENDFCLRAQDAGFSTLVADNCYIYHAKSKSFSHERRRKLAEKGHRVYTQTFGAKRLQANTHILQKLNPLDALRHRLLNLNGGNLSMCYILPVTAISGGVISVFQVVKHLNLMGVNASVIVPKVTYDKAKDLFEMGDKLLAFERVDDIPELCKTFDILVATHNSSVEYVRKTMKASGRLILPGYFVQDYEPWFYKPGSHRYNNALSSYELIPGQVMVAKTRYLVEKVLEHHAGVDIRQIRPGFDVSVYRPDSRHLQDHNPVRICAMVRPISPRRAPGETLRVLSRLLKNSPVPVEVHIFGADEKEMKDFKADPAFRQHGILSQQELFELLCDCDLFLDMSPYQAFGRTGLEAMAAGCLAVLPAGSGPTEYAEHDQTAVLLEMKDEKAVYKAIVDLLKDPERRIRLKSAALATAAEYNCMGDALMQWEIFSSAYRVRFNPPRVNVIILVRDKHEITRECLESLLSITSYSNYEVTVVANASGPETAEMLARYERKHENLRLITNQENRSFSAANNQGASASDAELLMFLNNDTEITDPDWLTRLVDELLRRPMTIAVGPRLLFPNHRVQSAGISVEVDPDTCSLIKASEIREPRDNRYVEGLTAACMLIRREPFMEAGGFDEQYFYGQEDVDLCLTLRSRGFKLYHCADVSLIHKESGTRKFDDNTLRNREIIRKKWLGRAINIHPVE